MLQLNREIMPIMPNRTKPNWIAKSTKDDPTRKFKSKEYNTVRWRKLRARLLTQEPLCRSCFDKGVIKDARVADHINPVRLGGRFWDIQNLQPLCDSCHNIKSGSEAKLYKQ